MKTVLIFVTTLDGKITRWGDPHIRKWSSSTDQDYFDTVWDNSHVIIMGAGTYDPAPVKADATHHFIIMTRQPLKYKDRAVPGKLEFTSESPALLKERLTATGEEKILVAGGAQIATLFLKQKLIDELWLTIEPKIFGVGGSMVIAEKLDINLKLLSSNKINEQGTLLTRYSVIRDIAH